MHSFLKHMYICISLKQILNKVISACLDLSPLDCCLSVVDTWPGFRSSSVAIATDLGHHTRFPAPHQQTHSYCCHPVQKKFKMYLLSYKKSLQQNCKKSAKMAKICKYNSKSILQFAGPNCSIADIPVWPWRWACGCYLFDLEGESVVVTCLTLKVSLWLLPVWPWRWACGCWWRGCPGCVPASPPTPRPSCPSNGASSTAGCACNRNMVIGEH